MDIVTYEILIGNTMFGLLELGFFQEIEIRTKFFSEAKRPIFA